MHAPNEAVADDQPRAVKRLKVAGAAVGAVIVAYWAAAVAGVSNEVISAVFTVGVGVLVVLAWWAARRAPSELRLFAVLASLAVTFQVIGTVLWYCAFLANGRETPEPPGYWTPFLWIGLSLGVAAAWAAVRRALRLREAILDYVIVAAAAAAVAVATVSYRLEPGLSGAAVDAIVRPVAGVLMVTLVVSAALGRWRALALPVGLFAVAQTFSAAGDIMFGWLTAEAAHTDYRWTGAVWFTGVLVAMLAAAAMILRVDRPIRLSREALPAVSPRALMLAAVGAWTVAGGVTLYGALGGRPASLYAGIAAGAVIGLAVSLRALSALEESRAAYRRLDEAQLSLERVAAERDATIETLSRRNVEHSAAQAMLGSLLELADDRSEGQLRARLEETAADVAEWLPQRRE